MEEARFIVAGPGPGNPALRGRAVFLASLRRD
jgi:hypothetical protein